MTTEFGKEMRKIRIDRDEVLKDMADRLGFSSSYISSIESGERAVSDKFYDALVRSYHLNEGEKEKLRVARANTQKEISLNLSSLSKGQAKVAISLQRTIKDLDADDIARIMSIIGDKEAK